MSMILLLRSTALRSVLSFLLNPKLSACSFWGLDQWGLDPKGC